MNVQVNTGLLVEYLEYAGKYRTATLNMQVIRGLPVEYLEHAPDVLHMSGTGEGGGLLADVLHQGLGCLCHLRHLLVVGLPPLLLTH